jgi:F-type H+-transporting ATPase subunit alpha
MLERSTHLRKQYGGGSLTALPIIETEAQDISSYIPTNLISITDGQIYLSPSLFQKGLLPAIDVGKSVSRVGGKAQLPAYRAVAGDLRIAYSQFEELESFSRFGTRLDDDTRRRLERGWRVREILKQPQLKPIRVAEQIASLLAVTGGALDRVPINQISKAEQTVRKDVTGHLHDLCVRIETGEKLSIENFNTILNAAQTSVAPMGEKTDADH